MNISCLPYDIQYTIALFVSDIDTRRHFKIYKTIDLKPFYFLDIENLHNKNKYRQNKIRSRFSFFSNFL